MVCIQTVLLGGIPPTLTKKRNTPGGRASYNGNLNEEFLTTIITHINKRGGVKLLLTKPSKSEKAIPLLYRRNGTRLIPDRLLNGVPGYNGIYLLRKSQQSRGSADEKYTADIDDACAGCYPEPVAFIMTLEFHNKNSKQQKKWDTILDYMRKKAKEKPQFVIGVFTLSEFQLWLEEWCYPYD